MRVLQREKSELERTCREMKEQLEYTKRSVVSYLHECHGCGMWDHASFEKKWCIKKSFSHFTSPIGSTPVFICVCIIFRVTGTVVNW